MGWQDIVGGALAGGATGDPFAWKKNQMQQMMQQFQMQKQLEQLQMQKDMHNLEKQKLEMAIKHFEAGNVPLDSLMTGGTPEVPATEGETVPTTPPYQPPNDFMSMFGGQQNPSEPMVGATQTGTPAIPATPGKLDLSKLTISQAKEVAPILTMLQKEKPSIHTVEGGLYEVPAQGGKATQLVAPTGMKDRPYKVGQVLPSQEVGDQLVNLQVTGYDENNMPTFKVASGGPRYKPPGPDKGPTQMQLNKTATDYRKEFNNLPEVKERNLIQPKLKSLTAAYEESKKTNNFVAVDQAMVTLFNKLTDPSSVVRESEYARTAQNLPFVNALKGKIEKVIKGGAGLTHDDRKNIILMAGLMEKAYEEVYSGRATEYRDYAKMVGANPDLIAKPATPTANKNSDPLGIRGTK